MGVVERYHAPLQRIFLVIKRSHPALNPRLALRLVIKGTNDTTGPEGLVPSLLVFGAIPSLPDINKLLSSQREGIAAIDLARAEMETITSELLISQGFRSKLSPVTQFHFKPGDHVRIYKEKERRWCGPVKVTKTSGKEITIIYGVK